MSGIVDGLIETVEGTIDIVQFANCYDPMSARAWIDKDCFDTREKTYNVLKQVYLVVSDADKLKEICGSVKESFDGYLKETSSVSNQGRYNHGKIAFNVVSLFVGVGEAKAILSGEKALATVLKEGISAYGKIPAGILKLTKHQKSTRRTKLSSGECIKFQDYI